MRVPIQEDVVETEAEHELNNTTPYLNVKIHKKNGKRCKTKDQKAQVKSVMVVVGEPGGGAGGALIKHMRQY